MSVLPIHIKPNGKVDIVDHEADGAVIEMWAVDAKHALASSPKRYSLFKARKVIAAAEQPAQPDEEAPSERTAEEGAAE